MNMTIMIRKIRMLKPAVLIFITLLAFHPNQAQTVTALIDTLLPGTWKGTSICQVKNSPCHDEIVVYHISKDKGVDSFYFNASKIVNGVEVQMGILPFVYNKRTNQVTSTAYGSWTFNIEGAMLEGTLFFHGDLYRKIKVYKHY
jgi:hypothetical protein